MPRPRSRPLATIQQHPRAAVHRRAPWTGARATARCTRRSVRYGVVAIDRARVLGEPHGVVGLLEEQLHLADHGADVGLRAGELAEDDLELIGEHAQLGGDRAVVLAARLELGAPALER